MTQKVLISGQTNILLWGVSPRLRLERQLRALNIYDISLDSPTIVHNNYDIIFNGEYVFDSQSLRFFLEQMRPCALVYNEIVIGLSAEGKSDANLLSYLGHNVSQLPQSVKRSILRFIHLQTSPKKIRAAFSNAHLSRQFENN